MKRVSRIGACIRRRRRHQPRRFIVSHCHNRARNFDNSGDIGVATVSITRFFFFFSFHFSFRWHCHRFTDRRTLLLLFPPAYYRLWGVVSISRSPILHRKVNIHTDNTGTDHFILYMHREYNNSSPTRVIPFKDDSISFQIGHYTVTQVWITEWRRGGRERKSYLIYEFHRGERGGEKKEKTRLHNRDGESSKIASVPTETCFSMHDRCWRQGANLKMGCN